MIWFLSVLVLVLIALLVVAAVRIEHLQARHGEDQHLDCVAVLSAAVGTRHEVYVLRQAARDYDTVAEQGRLGALARERYKPGGPSMPVIWLNDRADRIEEQNR